LNRPGPDSRLVYSTDGGRVREQFTPHNRKVEGAAPAKPSGPPVDGIVRVQRDKKNRGGKTVTTITGLAGSEAELDALLKELKQLCGAGGARAGSTLEIQGDHRERLRTRLEALGYRVKLAGG
jgi:translation initiation factor 1